MPPLAIIVAEYDTLICPTGNDVVVICSGAGTPGAMLTEKPLLAVSAGEPESFTWIVNAKVPDCVGIPLICPVDAASVSPGGKEPVNDQLYGVVPPPAVNVAEYVVPICPLGNDEVVICSEAGAAAMLIVRGLLAVSAGELESLTWAVNVNVPACDGVPEICPVEAVSVSPGGREPKITDQL